MAILDNESMHGLTRAFQKRIRAYDDLQATAAIGDFEAQLSAIEMMKAEKTGEMSKEPWTCKCGLLAIELLELLPAPFPDEIGKAAPTLPHTRRALWSHIVYGWTGSISLELEKLFASNLAKISVRTSEDVDWLRELLQNALDATRDGHNYTIGIMKASRLVANPGNEPMSGDLMQILGRWVGHRAPSELISLIGAIIGNIPDLAYTNAYYVYLMRPALTKFTGELAQIAEAAVELGKPLRESVRHIDIGWPTIEVDQITIAISKVNETPSPGNAMLLLRERALTVREWKAASELPGRSAKVRLTCLVPAKNAYPEEIFEEMIP